MSEILSSDAMRFGETEGGIYAISATAGVTYAIDLYSFGQGAPSLHPLSIVHAAGVIGYRFSNDPNGIINLGAVSGSQRAMQHGTVNQPFELFCPKGYRYLLFIVSSTSIVRVATLGPFSALTGPERLEYVHIYAEGDSNTSIDAASLVYGGTGKWWYQLQRLLGNRNINAKFVANVAQGGSQWTVGTGLAPNPIISATRQNALDGLAKPELVNVCFIQASTNDINTGDVLLTLQTNMRQWCDNRLASGDGWRIIPMAIPPQSLDGTKNAIVTAYNAWLPDLIGEGRAVAVAPLPSYMTNSQDTTYYTPNGSPAVAEHWNAQGGYEMAQQALSALYSVSWPLKP